MGQDNEVAGRGKSLTPIRFVNKPLKELLPLSNLIYVSLFLYKNTREGVWILANIDYPGLRVQQYQYLALSEGDLTEAIS